MCVQIEMMKAVSFMYVRPPGYNAESAKAAEIADETKREEQNNPSKNLPVDLPSSSKYCALSVCCCILVSFSCSCQLED